MCLLLCLLDNTISSYNIFNNHHNHPIYRSTSSLLTSPQYILPNIITPHRLLQEYYQSHSYYQTMQSNCSPLLRIYEGVYALMVFKRKIFEELALNSLPVSPLSDQRNMASTKIFLCLKKMASEVKSQLTDLAKHGKFENHVIDIGKKLAKLKSNTDFLTQQQKLLSEAASMIDHWSKVIDPLTFYQQGARSQLFGRLTSKLRQISAAASVSKETRKPLYIRKLQRELRDNLQMVSDQQRKYNKFQEAVGELIRRRLGKVGGKVVEGIGKGPRNSLVQEEKNQLLKKYIDIFNSSLGVKDKDQINYRKDIAKIAKNVIAIFTGEKRCFEYLLEYLRNLVAKLQSVRKNIIAREDQVSRQTCNISQDINSAICFEQALEIFASTKDFISFSDILQNLIEKIEKLTLSLDEAIENANEFATKIKQRDASKHNPVQLFINDKKCLQTFIQKQTTFQSTLYNNFLSFMQFFMRRVTHSTHRQTKSEQVCKLRAEKVFQRLFTTYFEQTEAYQKKNTAQIQQPQPVSSLRSSYSGKISQMQKFLKELSIFQQNTDWSDSYQCSLGPKLLIHGKLKIFASGVYYQSNFNKKNLFFGKTRLFIPRQDIFQINKESALIIFPDVVEIVTKKGNVYFHALGKRDNMCNHLNDMFFPEINNPALLEEDFPFNSFDGSSSVEENRIKQYLNKLEYQIESGDIHNIDFRTFFHKYESEHEFIYQGKTYKDFKHFTIELAQGSNIQGSNFTPSIPSYLRAEQLHPHPEEAFDEDPSQSQRSFTYDKSVPLIPLVSKGGSGVCKQRSVYRWGGPKCLVIDIFTTLTGFSLTQGMTVHSRRVYKEKNNVIHYQLSGSVTFQSNSAINTLLRTPALANLKTFHNQLFEVIKKLQRNKRPKTFSSMKKVIMEDEQDHLTKIDQLKKQNDDLRKLIKHSGLAIVLLYIFTVMILIL